MGTVNNMQIQDDEGNVYHPETSIKQIIDESGNPMFPGGNPGKMDSSEMTVEFEEAKTRENIKSGEKHGAIFGKIQKFLSDLKTVAFSGKYGDLSERPALGGAAGYKVADNDTTNSSDFLSTARVAYEHGQEIDALSRDLGGLAFAQDTDGNWGYKIGGADPVIPFKTEPFVYDFSDGTFNLSDSSKPYYVKDYKKLTKQNFHGSCSWSCYEYFHHTDTADHEHRNSGGISFTYSPDTGTLIVKRNQTNGFITLVC